MGGWVGGRMYLRPSTTSARNYQRGATRGRTPIGHRLPSPNSRARWERSRPGFGRNVFCVAPRWARSRMPPGFPWPHGRGRLCHGSCVRPSPPQNMVLCPRSYVLSRPGSGVLSLSIYPVPRRPRIKPRGRDFHDSARAAAHRANWRIVRRSNRRIAAIRIVCIRRMSSLRSFASPPETEKPWDLVTEVPGLSCQSGGGLSQPASPGGPGTSSRVSVVALRECRVRNGQRGAPPRPNDAFPLHRVFHRFWK